MRRFVFSKLSLLWKILLSTSVAVTLLFAITGEIVLRNISRTMTETLEQEVKASFRAYASLWKSQTDLLSAASRIISEMSDVRSAFGTGDKATIQDSAGELWRKVSDADAFFLVTDPRGNAIATLGGENALRSPARLVEAALAQFPGQAAGFFAQDGELYHVSATPVYVQSTHDTALINVLVAGYRIDALVSQRLKEATGGSEFLFRAADQGGITSTLNPRAARQAVAALDRARGAELVSDGSVEYAWVRTPLLDVAGRRAGDLYILRSFAAARQRITGLYKNIILLWLGAMGAGLALSFLLARRIVDPVKRLDRAAAEVARQNYAIEVPVNGSDEMGRLAQSFNSMCASIRRAREELIRQERIATIGRLSGSIVHDLRNPLAAIYGGAEMLVDGDLPAGHVKRLAGNIYRASRRIQELLQDLLDVSRGKNRPMELCRLRDVASAARETVATFPGAQDSKVTIRIPPEIEVPVDRSRMERTFVNLIANAVEAMPHGGEVRISALIENGAAVVDVEDDGPGIPPEIRASLFQPFVSAGKRNGLGLGLALSRQTVLDHGGDMWLESQPGKRACFRFRLPGAVRLSEVGDLRVEPTAETPRRGGPAE